MSAQIINMGMIFDENDAPDFGSVFMSKHRESGVNDYGLLQSDADKLSLITNASPGSTALCIDTQNLYILTLDGWVMFGG